MTPDVQLELGSGEEGVPLTVDLDEVVDAELVSAAGRAPVITAAEAGG